MVTNSSWSALVVQILDDLTPLCSSSDQAPRWSSNSSARVPYTTRAHGGALLGVFGAARTAAPESTSALSAEPTFRGTARAAASTSARVAAQHGEGGLASRFAESSNMAHRLTAEHHGDSRAERSNFAWDRRGRRCGPVPFQCTALAVKSAKSPCLACLRADYRQRSNVDCTRADDPDASEMTIAPRALTDTALSSTSRGP